MQQIRELYKLDGWNGGYFDINLQGEVGVTLRHRTISFSSLVEKAKALGLHLPLLIRFPDIIRHRLELLTKAFKQSILSHQYQGDIQIVYPIKVNQHPDVIQTILHHQNGARVGVEVGSKAEMLAVLSLLEADKPTTVICNGYKDSQVVRFGLIGQKLGHQVIFVLEKPSELAVVLEEANRLGVRPNLGVRARLCSMGKGNWQNTGGEKSKFGLSATHLLQLIQKLKAENAIDCLKLLHFHLGSQISDIDDLERGMQECAQFYVQLRKLGVPIETVDVGGGLGVDYEGGGSTHYFSMNYSIDTYAERIVKVLSDTCEQRNLPHPHIITESGRAMTAHHAVLITNVVNQEKALELEHLPSPSADHPLLVRLWDIYEKIAESNAQMCYQSANQCFGETKEAYVKGELSLEQRSAVEQLMALIYRKLQQAVTSEKTKTELQEKLAEKWICNFSVFQSTPDVWGIDQIFPILPLSGLSEMPSKEVVIQDITCDSDGRIDCYVSARANSSTLPVPQDVNLIGIFLVGAYQEILGDMHNLFGDTDSVRAELNEQGEFELKHPISGDTVQTVLAAVHFEKQDVIAHYRKELKRAKLTEFQKELEAALTEGTYLKI